MEVLNSPGIIVEWKTMLGLSSCGRKCEQVPSLPWKSMAARAGVESNWRPGNVEPHHHHLQHACRFGGNGSDRASLKSFTLGRGCRDLGSTTVVHAGWSSKKSELKSQLSAVEILRLLTSSGSNVQQVLDNQAQNLKPSDWFTVLDSLGKQQKWILALEIFRWMQRQKWYRPDNGFYSKLISIMGKAKQLRLAVWLFGEVKRSGHRPDTSLYNALITAYLRSREPGRGLQKAEELLQEMKAKPKCLPNLVTYNIFLRACAQSGEVERVQGFFKEMVAAHIYPDIFSYNGVIDAYGKTGNYDEMEKTLTMMRGEHCKPDLVTYNTLIDAYGRAKAFPKMEQVLKSMKGAKSKHKPDLSTYNIIIYSYARAGDSEKMEWTLGRMDAALFKPNLATYEFLVIGYAHAGAFQLMLERLTDILEGGEKPRLATSRAILEAYCKHNLFEEAEELLHKVKNWYKRPNAPLYLIVLRAYGKQNRLEDMERLLEHMKMVGVLPTEAAFVEFLDLFESSWNEKDGESDMILEGDGIDSSGSPSTDTLICQSNVDV